MICPASGKYQYHDKGDAMRAIVQLKTRPDKAITGVGRGNPSPLEPYKCRRCGCWHIGHSRREAV